MLILMIAFSVCHLMIVDLSTRQIEQKIQHKVHYFFQKISTKQLRSMCVSERNDMLPVNVIYRFKHRQGMQEHQDIGVRYSDEEQSRTLSFNMVIHSPLLKVLEVLTLYWSKMLGQSGCKMILQRNILIYIFKLSICLCKEFILYVLPLFANDE